MWQKVAPAVGAALFGVAVWVLARELDRIGFASLTASLAAVPRGSLAAALALTVLDYIVLTCNDQLAFTYARVQVNRARIALASFIGYAVSNSVGLALLSGTSARYRFYSRWGVTPSELSRIVTFYSGTFWVGLLLIGGASLAFAPSAGLDSVIARPLTLGAGILGLTAVAAYVVLCLRRTEPIRVRRFEIALPGRSLMIAQLVVSTLDWLLAASIIYALLPAPRPSLLTVTGAFAASQLVALASHVPGGLGVFEGMMFLILDDNVGPSGLAPALFLFRAIYYLLPLVVALVALLVDEARERRDHLSRWTGACHAVAVWAAPRILAVFTFASGALLLFSGATPAIPERISWLSRLVPLPLVELSHFAASLTGLALLLLSEAIAQRIDAAFYVTSVALAVGSVASLLRGAEYEEATVLALVLAGLLAARRHFTRRASLLEYPLSARWLGGVLTVVGASIWLGFFAYRHVGYANDLWWQFTVNGDAPRFLRASVAVTIAALVVAARQLLSPALPRHHELDVAATQEIDRVIAQQPRTLPYLAYLGDKSVLWNDTRTAFLMYAVRGRSCVALSDPVGPSGAARELVPRFLEICHQAALTPVFYEATGDMLEAFADHGLSVVKIGEEARVRLDTFTVSGNAHKSLRSSINRVEREGFTFRVAPPAEVDALLPELQDISDDWLERKGTAEKGFSLGYFNERYLRRFPVALIERDGRIEAFANLWPGPGRVELSADMMRYRASAPPGVMDTLFVRVATWGQAEAYLWFNLGMAPLSGIPSPAYGTTWNRLGQFVFRHGEAFYHFQGLRAYKQKFDPEWRPRYLAYPGGLALARVIGDVTALVAGGYRRLFVRRTGRRAA
jgi:phosphatidylglycerol lysyltransferase